MAIIEPRMRFLKSSMSVLIIPSGRSLALLYTDGLLIDVAVCGLSDSCKTDAGGI